MKSTTTIPPGPRGSFLLGSLRDLQRRPLAFFTELKERYGDVAHFRAAGVDAYHFSHPDQIEEILIGENRSFIKPKLLRDAGEVLGHGLLTSDGDLWLRQRRLMAPAFHRERIASYGGAMVERTERMLEGWREGEEIDIHEAMMRLTLGIVAETLFGADVEEHAAQVGESLELALQRFIERMSLVRLLDPLPLPRNIRFRRGVSRLDDVIFGMIDQRRRDGAERNDLLSILLRATDDEGGMSDRQLRDEVVTLFLAGHETTAIALTWTWYLLGLNPERREELEAELDRVLGDRAPTVADLPALPFTDAVMRESMRIYPPAWRVGREAIRDVEIGDVTVPRGAQVVASQWVVHRDERWFQDPLLFRPERWLDGSTDDLPRFAYFPFGGGARRCIGDGFAMMEASLLLATIARGWRLELRSTQPVLPFPSITMRPRGGVRVALNRRRS